MLRGAFGLVGFVSRYVAQFYEYLYGYTSWETRSRKENFSILKYRRGWETFLSLSGTSYILHDRA